METTQKSSSPTTKIWFIDLNGYRLSQVSKNEMCHRLNYFIWSICIKKGLESLFLFLLYYFILFYSMFFFHAWMIVFRIYSNVKDHFCRWKALGINLGSDVYKASTLQGRNNHSDKIPELILPSKSITEHRPTRSREDMSLSYRTF